VLHQEIAVPEVAHDREHFSEELQDRVFLRVGLHVVPREDPPARVDEEGTEDVEQPVEPGDEGGADEDEGGPHDHGAQDPPEEDPPLVQGGDAERPEDEDEDEEVVDGQGVLDDVPRHVLDGDPVPEAPEEARPEEERHADPPGGPGGRLPHRHLVRIPPVHRDVYGQQDEDEGEEPPQSAGVPIDCGNPVSLPKSRPERVR